MDNQKLDFIKPITDNTNYREEQEELITKAKKLLFFVIIKIILKNKSLF